MPPLVSRYIRGYLAGYMDGAAHEREALEAERETRTVTIGVVNVADPDPDEIVSHLERARRAGRL